LQVISIDLVLAFVTTYTYMAIFVYTSEKQCHKIRKEYLKAVMRQNIAWFDTVGAGEVSTRITSDTLLIQDAIGEKLPLAASQAASFLGGFGIAFWRSWKMTLVLMSVIPLITISSGIMNVINAKFQTRIQNLYSKSGNIAEESIAAARTITSFNAQEKVSKRYNESLAGARKEGIKKSVTSGIGLGALLLFLYLSYSLAFWFGHILLRNNEITVGIVVNVFFAVMIGAFALGQMAPDLQAFALGVGAGTKIFETIDTIPIIDPYNQNGIKIEREALQGRIELRSVDFTYPSRPDVPILKKLDLTIEPGTTVALVGQSGSGKSTVVQLIERFYDPLSGSVFLDGHDLRSLNLNSFRQHIGLVSQEPTLFEGSVYENVCHGLYGSKYQDAEENVKRDLVINACEQANAHDFIMKLPKGYDTQVGERGMLLSGGQKQRVAIARAIIKDPKILLLDEATSALDTQSERIVQEALDRVSQTRTTIAIAHRLSTIKNADKIVCMVKGEIVEQGTHSELIANRSLYAKLVEAQNLHNEKGKEAKVSQKEDDMATANVSDKVAKEASNHDLEAGTGKKYRTLSIMYQIMKLNAPELKYSIPALIAAIGAGLINPFFAISFAEIVEAFSKKGSQLEQETNKWAIIFIIIAIAGFVFTFFQNTLFGFASELLTERIRKSTFATILRQDIGFFDQEENATGVLTSNLAGDAQKVQGVSGAIVGTMLQIWTNLVGSIIIALIYGWKLGLVATAALPLLLFTGVMRMKIIV
jgi:ATP-binding cassette subfamily B (MDR/TAP) protein 1